MGVGPSSSFMANVSHWRWRPVSARQADGTHCVLFESCVGTPIRSGSCDLGLLAFRASMCLGIAQVVDGRLCAVELGSVYRQVCAFSSPTNRVEGVPPKFQQLSRIRFNSDAA